MHASEDWLAAATTRETVLTPDGKSGAVLERLVVDGEAYVLKHIRAADDWIMRVTGDDGTWFLSLWTSGTLAWLPPVIDTAVVDVFAQPGGSAILMHDVGDWLVPGGDTPVDLDQHRRFVDHLAALHADFWDWADTLGLLGLERRYAWFTPAAMRSEAARPEPSVIPRLAVTGWERLPEVAPGMAEQLFALQDDPRPFLAALASGPHTLVHGDVKLGNLGSRPDGATVMIDWALPGRAPPAFDLAHYLALELLPPTRGEGGGDRGLPGRPRAGRGGHRRLVRRPGGPRPPRPHAPHRLGEGTRRPRPRAHVVGRCRRPCRASPGPQPPQTFSRPRWSRRAGCGLAISIWSIWSWVTPRSSNSGRTSSEMWLKCQFDAIIDWTSGVNQSM